MSKFFKIIHKYPKKTIWKILVMGVCLEVILFAVYTAVVAIDDVTEIFSMEESISSCEWRYYDGQYHQLLKGLTYSGKQDKKHEKFWEIGEAYDAFYQYNLWKDSYEQLDADNLEYKEKAIKYGEKVKEAYEKTEDEENKVILEALVKKIEY